MPSITTWTRLEPYPYSDALRPALRAALHDPLWMLARQWQMGEFQGEDNGSPIWVELAGEQFDLTRYRAGNSTKEGVPYDSACTPLEAQVESEPLDGNALRLRVESGTHFLKLLGGLAGPYRAAYLAAAGLKPLLEDEAKKADADKRRFVTTLAGRAVDGRRLYEVTADGGLGVPLNNPADEAVLATAVAEWRKAYAPLFEPAASPAWAGERLEYSFAVAAPMPLVDRERNPVMNETVLRAAEYHGGHLDWPSFSISVDTDPKHAMGAAGDRPGTPVSHAGPPAPMRYPGMPVSRFWQFEDSRVNFGAVDAAADDLGRMLLLEFALVYGNDFFLVPLELPVGSLCRINKLMVRNTFGEEYPIAPAGALENDPWRMFALSVEGGKADNNLLLLPPTLGVGFEGQVMEEVAFARDEMANLAWAIERQVTGGLHRPVQRYEQWAHRELPSPPEAAPTVAGEAAARYRLITEVPDYWYPLELEAVDEGQLRLRLYNPDRRPQGRLLTEVDPFVLREEEVPRSGLRVRRAYQYTRWVDGSHHVWIGRRKEMGRGEASSGLRFDYLEMK